MTAAIATITQFPVIQEDYTIYPTLVPGFWLYEEMLVNEPDELGRLMEQERQTYLDTSTPAYHQLMRQADAEYAADIANHGKWWHRAQEAHAQNVSMGIVDNYTRRDAYGVLGINANAKPTKQIIKNAYRRKAKQLHPDIGGDADAMKHLNAAYRVLTQH